MKILRRQRNSKHCIICGLDNASGVRAPFYNVEGGGVASVFAFSEIHQSYPGRVHGGMITAMIDELALRALWAKEDKEENFAVTFSIQTKFRKPVPYGEKLVGLGNLISDSPRFVAAECKIYDTFGNELASGEAKYIKLAADVIAPGTDTHEEMCYLIDDGLKEI